MTPFTRSVGGVLAGIAMTLSIAGPATAHADDTMTVDQASHYYLMTMCRLNDDIGEFDDTTSTTTFESFNQVQGLTRWMARRFTAAASKIVEAPAPWPTSPKVMPKLRKLVTAMTHANRQLRATSRARTIGAWRHGVRLSARKVSKMWRKARLVDTKLGIANHHTFQETCDTSLIS